MTLWRSGSGPRTPYGPAAHECRIEEDGHATASDRMPRAVQNPDFATGGVQIRAINEDEVVAVLHILDVVADQVLLRMRILQRPSQIQCRGNNMNETAVVPLLGNRDCLFAGNALFSVPKRVLFENADDGRIPLRQMLFIGNYKERLTRQADQL